MTSGHAALGLFTSFLHADDLCESVGLAWDINCNPQLYGGLMSELAPMLSGRPTVVHVVRAVKSSRAPIQHVLDVSLLQNTWLKWLVLLSSFSELTDEPTIRSIIFFAMFIQDWNYFCQFPLFRQNSLLKRFETENYTSNPQRNMEVRSFFFFYWVLKLLFFLYFF